MFNNYVFYRIFIFLFFSFLILACGTSTNPSTNNANELIDITTQKQLSNIRYNLAGTSYKTSASDASKDCGGSVCRGYELLNNITLNPNWQPIGSADKPFTSILQGNGYSITNLVIDGENNLGLFAALAGATIDNLVVEVISIAGNDNVGTLAGSAENSTISRLHIRAANTSSKLSAGGNIGGILGKITDATITNVTSNLNVVGSNNNVGGIAGYVSSSDISYATSSGSVTSSGSRNFYYGGLVGLVEYNSAISYSSASGSVTSSGKTNFYYGGLVGWVKHNSAISYSSASGSVTSSGGNNSRYGGLVGLVEYNSAISYSSASGSVTSSGGNNFYYGGLVGWVKNNSAISYSSASGSVTGSGGANPYYGGLVGELSNSAISYSSASGSVTSSGEDNNNYGGLVGTVLSNSAISYSSASGSVTSSREDNNNYGGLVGLSAGKIMYSWSSSSVFANNPAGLVGNNTGSLGFSYALGNASYGLVNTNTGTITNSYWNSETSGALAAAKTMGVNTNTTSSNTVGMLGSTGSAGASVFAGFAATTDESSDNIWSFASDSYPVIRQLGVDEQAVALAYGLLRLASPNVGASTLDSFLGGTLNHEAITLDANSYNANEPFAILDVNLLASNNGCSIENSGNSLVSNSANSTKVKLIVNLAKTSSNLHRRIVYQDCNIAFDNAAVLQAGNRLQLAATITKGSASLSKNFIINFR